MSILKVGQPPPKCAPCDIDAPLLNSILKLKVKQMAVYMPTMDLVSMKVYCTEAKLVGFGPLVPLSW